MAITIDATVGGANANSYLTLAERKLIIDGFVEDADVTAWASATTDQKTVRFIAQHNG
jgi:sugar lactone lactonase YvrE